MERIQPSDDSKATALAIAFELVAGVAIPNGSAGEELVRRRAALIGEVAASLVAAVNPATKPREPKHHTAAE